MKKWTTICWVLSLTCISGFALATPTHRVSGSLYVRTGPGENYPSKYALTDSTPITVKKIVANTWAKIGPNEYVGLRHLRAVPKHSLAAGLKVKPKIHKNKDRTKLATVKTNPSNIKWLAWAAVLSIMVLGLLSWRMVCLWIGSSVLWLLDRFWNRLFPGKIEKLQQRSNWSHSPTGAEELLPQPQFYESVELDALIEKHVGRPGHPRVQGLSIGMASPEDRLGRYFSLTKPKRVQVLPVMRFLAHLENKSEVIFEKLENLFEEALEKQSLQKALVQLDSWSCLLGVGLSSELSEESRAALARFRKTFETESFNETPYQLLHDILGELDVATLGNRPTTDIAYELSALPDDFLAEMLNQGLCSDDAAAIVTHLNVDRFALHLGLISKDRAKDILRAIYNQAGHLNSERTRTVLTTMRQNLDVKKSPELHLRTQGYLLSVFETIYPKGSSDPT